MLARLVERWDDRRFEGPVVVLDNVGLVGGHLKSAGLDVIDLGIGRASRPLAVTRLARVLRREQPHVVHAWMYHANLVAGLAAPFAGHPAMVWSVHHRAVDTSLKRATRWVARAGAALSTRVPDAIVAVSEDSLEAHVDAGFAADRMTVIPNGADLQRFRPDPDARQRVRAAERIPADAPVVGLVGRYTPEKDHGNFFSAAAHIASELPAAHFLLAGERVTPDNLSLVEMARQARVDDRTRFLGARADVAELLATLDVLVLSSTAEASPLVVGEAMACGVPCVITDVGDGPSLVADTGRIVPPSDPRALADGTVEVLGMEPDARAAIGKAARNRIAEHFDLSDSVRAYEDLYSRLRGGRSSGADELRE